MIIELTVKELAHKERVTERTVWNWIDKGAVTIRRTPGGGVRILYECNILQSSETSTATPSTAS